MRTKIILVLVTALLEVFTTIVQRIFTENTLHSRNRKKSIQLTAWAVFFLIFNGISYSFAGNVWIHLGVFFIPFLTLMQFLYQDKFTHKLYVGVFLYLSGMCAELISYYMTSAIVAHQNIEDDKVQFFIVGTLTSKILWFYIIKILLLFINKNRTRSISYDWLEMILTPVGTILVFFTCFSPNNLAFVRKGLEWYFQLLGITILLLINLVTYCMYEQEKEATAKKMKEQTLREQCNYYIHQCEETTKLWMAMRQFRHDMKQRNLYVRGLLEQERYEELKQYYDETLEYLQSQKKVASTGCIYFDSIINYKAEVAARDDIVFVTELQIPQDCRVDGDECCVCLGNLLDNAIEAAKEAEPKERRISLKILAQGDNLYLEIINPYVQPRIQKNGSYLTTKLRSREHGFGLGIIREIVERHHGELDIQDDGSQFRVMILLYNVLQ